MQMQFLARQQQILYNKAEKNKECVDGERKEVLA